MAPFALGLMAAGLALFWAGAGWLGARIGQGAWRWPAVALCFVLAEALRGRVLTGFPWASLGHVWIDTPVAQLAALTGPLGLGLLTFLLAAAPAMARGRMLRMGAAAGAAAAIGALWVWGAHRIAAPLPAPAHDVQLRLVQPNAPQHEKWQPGKVQMFFERQLDLTAAPSPVGMPRPDLTIWAETAVPFLLEHPGIGLDLIADAAAPGRAALGVQRVESGRYFNSLAVLDRAARPTHVYDKHHLVPFGEYVPLAEALLGAGYAGFAARQLSGYSPGPGPLVLDLGPLGRALPLICYEAVFPRHLRTAERPDWILQVTNDAWFGTLSGPYQHLAQSRLRAIEQGLPLVRVANTGVSAVIGPRGQILAALPLNNMGALDHPLPGALPPTHYARVGDLPALVFLVVALAAVAAINRHRDSAGH